MSTIIYGWNGQWFMQAAIVAGKSQDHSLDYPRQMDALAW